MTDLSRLQQQAQKHFEQHGLPSKRLEHWRYTSLKALLPNINWSISPDAIIEAPLMPQAPKGVTITPLANLLQKAPEKLTALLSQHPIDYHHHPMAALSHAQLHTGLWIEIDDNIVLDQPITLSNFAMHELTHHFHVIHLGKNSHATIIEQTQHTDGTIKKPVINSMTNVICHSGARLQYYLKQPSSAAIAHIANLQLQQYQDTHVYAFNATQLRMGRFDIHAHLLQPGATCCLNGIFNLANQYHVDHNILVEHTASHTSSDIDYKGLAKDRAHGIWNAHTIAHANTTQLSIRQNNQNLLLSRHATIDTNPILEIYTEDLTCAHGATVGQLDANALLYLESRGIQAIEAKRVLTEAFCADIFSRIPNPDIIPQLGLLHEKHAHTI